MNTACEHELKVANLEVTYNKSTKSAQKVLQGIHFSLRKAEKLGILGESGSGKSTCARAILRLLEGDIDVQGEVIFEGKNLLAISDKELRKVRPKIQMIFQDPFSSFDPRQKLCEALAEPLRVHFHFSTPQIKHKVSRAIAEVGLSDEFLLKLPAQLSGGQLQRVSIARALLFEPKILIADEAVSALDLSLQAQIVTLLSELSSRRKMSILFISHDLRLVRYFCDRVLVLQNGKIIEHGEVEEVFVHPKSEYTQYLIKAAILGRRLRQQESCLN